MFESRWYFCEREWNHSSSITCQMFKSMIEANDFSNQNKRSTPFVIYNIPFIIPKIFDKSILYLNLRHSFYQIYLK